MSRSLSPASDKDTLVKTELCKFILKNTGLDALNSVDEIVMSYIIGVLESLESSNEPEDVFDVNEFVEMMSAYIPAFSTINTSDIHEWMLQLADFLKENSKKNGENHYALEDILFRNYETMSAGTKNKTEGEIDSKCQGLHPRRRSYHSSCSCSSSQSEDDDRCISITIDGMSTEIDTLIEMFPNLHIMEAKQFLGMADGDCEHAVQLILQKQENGEQLTDSLVTKNLINPKMGCSKEKVEDKKLREQILKRYAYIDQDDDVREHKPIAPKMVKFLEPKKLIRYRDNKIVSMKGERYSEVKNADTGESK